MSMYGESGHLPGSDEVRYVSAYLIHEKVSRNFSSIEHSVTDSFVTMLLIGSSKKFEGVM